VSASFQVSDVEELLALMEQWGIGELHLSVEDATLDLVRATAQRVGGEAAPVMTAPAPGAPEAVEAGIAELVTINAPVVGIFHLATRGFPQRAPHPGDSVQAGQNIGSIELMRIPTDLVSPVSGTIEGILVDDGAGVEYGQPLMVIRPYEEVSEDEAGMLPPPR
jgi:acetyl-CoA carboxylase biotin carboxyl carrier protein